MALLHWWLLSSWWFQCFGIKIKPNQPVAVASTLHPTAMCPTASHPTASHPFTSRIIKRWGWMAGSIMWASMIIEMKTIYLPECLSHLGCSSWCCHCHIILVLFFYCNIMLQMPSVHCFFAEQCHCWSQLLLLLWLLKLIFCFCHHTALLYFSADGLPKQLLLSLLILWHSWPAKIATTVFHECSCHHPALNPPPNFSCSHILVTVAVTACCPVLLSLALPCTVNNAAMVVAVLAASPLVDCWVLVWKPLSMRLL